MIKEKIYSLLDLNESLPIPENIIAEFSEAIAYGLKRQIFFEKSVQKNLRVSALGKCLRQQFYSIKGYEGEVINPRTKMTFLFGDIVEAVVVTLAKASGVELIEQQKEVDVDGVKGHIDGLIKTEDGIYLFECKSMADASFKNLTSSGLSDDFGYLTQVNMYMYALGLDRAYLVAVNKNTGHIEEVEIPRDEDLIEKTLNNISVLRSCLESDNLPPRKYEPVLEKSKRGHAGRMILPIPCSYCAYKNFCWENLQQDFKNNKPIWVVKEEQND